jgi:hypothetical protein
MEHLEAIVQEVQTELTALRASVERILGILSKNGIREEESDKEGLF